MSDNEDCATFYITKEEFKRRMAQNQLMLGGLAKAYADRMTKTQNEWEQTYCQAELDQLVKDIDFNRKLMKRADIEEPYAVYFIKGEEEQLFIGRIGKEQHKKYTIQNLKNPSMWCDGLSNIFCDVFRSIDASGRRCKSQRYRKH
jgi:hypothetical protein